MVGASLKVGNGETHGVLLATSGKPKVPDQMGVEITLGACKKKPTWSGDQQMVDPAGSCRLSLSRVV